MDMSMPPLPARAAQPQLQIPADTLARLKAAFDAFVQQQDGVQAAVLATVDGFEIASHSRSPSLSADNLAALSSSLTAIASAVAGELSFKGCDRLLLESESGKIVFQPVRSVVPCTACVALSSEVLLGRTLWALDEFARTLRALR